jgi:hypothetical protein
MIPMIHPHAIPSFHGELMRSTSLTQHKGGLGVVLAVVAMVLIPYAAPLIATAIAGSFGVTLAAGSLALTAGSGLVGAGLGAGFAAIQGGNIALGALGGAFSGAIAGAHFAPSGAGAGAYDYSGGMGADAGITGVNPGQFVGTGDVPSSAGLISGGDATGVAAASDGFTAGDFAGPDAVDSFTAVDGSDGFTAGDFAGPDAVDSGFDVLGPDAGGFNESVSQDLSSNLSGGGVDPTGEYDYSGGIGADTGVTGVRPRSAPNAAQGGFSDKVSGFFDNNPRLTYALKQGAGKLGSKFLANAFVGGTPDMSDEERQLLNDNEAARRQQQALLIEQRQRAAGLFQQAENLNPEYYGQQALTKEQNRLNRAQQAGLRNISPSSSGLRDNTVRRNALQKSRLGGYARGANDATTRRLQYTQAAIAANPTGDNIASGIRADQKSADLRYSRLAGERQNAENVIAPIINAGLGYETEEQKKKRLQQV